MSDYRTQLEKNSEAMCVSNYHGRILDANRRFCRLFSMDDEFQWNFLLDLHRRKNDWEQLQEYVEKYGAVSHYYTRMKNRKGRSFHCMVSRERILENGEIIYISRIQKVDALKKQQYVPNQDFTAEVNDSLKGVMIYLHACEYCDRVQDGMGNWVIPGAQTIQAAGKSGRHVCPQCAKEHYAGLSWENIRQAQN
jgi:PAS domain S-box-containing protein